VTADMGHLLGAHAAFKSCVHSLNLAIHLTAAAASSCSSLRQCKGTELLHTTCSAAVQSRTGSGQVAKEAGIPLPGNMRKQAPLVVSGWLPRIILGRPSMLTQAAITSVSSSNWPGQYHPPGCSVPTKTSQPRPANQDQPNQ
jgi:hypothetical protein